MTSTGKNQTTTPDDVHGHGLSATNVNENVEPDKDGLAQGLILDENNIVDTDAVDGNDVEGHGIMLTNINETASDNQDDVTGHGRELNTNETTETDDTEGHGIAFSNANETAESDDQDDIPGQSRELNASDGPNPSPAAM
jgi:hypothetical protein